MVAGGPGSDPLRVTCDPLLVGADSERLSGGDDLEIHAACQTHLWILGS